MSALFNDAPVLHSAPSIAPCIAPCTQILNRSLHSALHHAPSVLNRSLHSVHHAPSMLNSSLHSALQHAPNILNCSCTLYRTMHSAFFGRIIKTLVKLQCSAPCISSYNMKATMCQQCCKSRSSKIYKFIGSMCYYEGQIVASTWLLTTWNSRSENVLQTIINHCL